MPEDATAWETLYRACRVVAESFAGMADAPAADGQPLAERAAV